FLACTRAKSKTSSTGCLATEGLEVCSHTDAGQNSPAQRALALGVLRRLAGTLEAWLLALLGARVARQEPSSLQRGAHVAVYLAQGPRNAQTHSRRLAALTTTVNLHADVVGCSRAGQGQRLAQNHLV